MEKMSKKINIALIDSGISRDLVDVDVDINFVDFGLFENNNDSIEHGSYVAFILSKSIPDINIYSIKIFDSNYITKEEDIIKAFQWVLDNDFIDIVHFSGGCNAISHYNELNKLINEIVRRGILIVSAFENIGQCTWPAACKNVIGVKWNKYIRNVRKYFFIKNSQVDILGFGGIIAIPNSGNRRIRISGSSFSTPYITAKIVEIIRRYNIKKNKKRLELTKEILAKEAEKIIELKTVDDEHLSFMKTKVKDINKAVIFPFNKEVHSIVGNTDLLKFEISNVYDLKYFGHVGKKIKDCCYCNIDNDMAIDSIENIDWDSDFDTIILGHLDMLEVLENNVYNINYFLKNAYKYKKNIYLFDQSEVSSKFKSMFNDIGCNIMEFHVDYIDKNFGCMKLLNIPVLAVVGTSSKQGKYNLQLELRRKFLEDGYKVEQLGTEPNSLLFGMDIMYSNGYGTNNNLDIENEIMYINEQAWLNSIDKEILIVGTQSQTIPYGYGNIGFYNFGQQSILCATNPDSFIICVNASDEIGYIRRTIVYLESFYEGEVIAIVVFPFNKYFSNNIDGKISKMLDDNELLSVCEKFSLEFGKPCLVNGNTGDMNKLYKLVLNNF